MFDMQKNEVKFLYNSSKKQDRVAYGYAMALNKHKINELDVAKTPLTSTQISQLAQTLHVPIIQLFDENAAGYRDNVKGKDMDDHDLLTILKEEPDNLRTPIMVFREKAIFLESEYDTNSMDIAIQGIKDFDTNQ